MVGKHFIEQIKGFGDFKTDEKELKIKTRVEWATMLKEKLDGLKKKFTCDAKERLIRNERFALIITHKKHLTVRVLQNYNNKNPR